MRSWHPRRPISPRFRRSVGETCVHVRPIPPRREARKTLAWGRALSASGGRARPQDHAAKKSAPEGCYAFLSVLRAAEFQCCAPPRRVKPVIRSWGLSREARNCTPGYGLAGPPGLQIASAHGHGPNPQSVFVAVPRYNFCADIRTYWWRHPAYETCFLRAMTKQSYTYLPKKVI